MATKISQDDATEFVQLNAATAEWPDISPRAVAMCVKMSAKNDTFGRLPGTTGYVEYYDLNQATALAWGMKAAYAAGRYDQTSGGVNQSRKQAFDNCLAMETKWKNKIIGTEIGYGATLAATAKLLGIPLDVAYGNLPLVDASDVGEGLI